MTETGHQIIYLVQEIIQALVQMLQVQQDNSPASFHANLYLIDVTTHLHTLMAGWQEITDNIHTYVLCILISNTVVPV